MTDKAAVRHSMRDTLAAIDADAHMHAANACAMHASTVLPEHGSGVLMGYLPMADELNVEPIMQAWLADGGHLAAPRPAWDTRTMQAIALPSLDPSHVHTGRHGVREPAGNQVIDDDALAAILVPGLAFDHRGHRLGRGGGFYDRFLARLGPQILRIGVCMDEQIIGAVPCADHDQRVHVVLSPTGIVDAR